MKVELFPPWRAMTFLGSFTFPFLLTKSEMETQIRKPTEEQHKLKYQAK